MKHLACEKCARSVGKVNIVGNILMISIKGYLGVVGGSKGLIADAIHSCADLLATILMIIGLSISGRKKDGRYPYGYGKAEYVVAIVIYLFLFLVGLYILMDGIRAIHEGRNIPHLSAAWGAIFSIAINELMFRQSVCAGTQINSPSITAKAWESRSDVYSSIAVLAGILGAKMGFHFMDPLAAIAVGVIILRICVQMIKDALLKLMDKGASDDILDDARQALAGLKDMAGIMEINAREVGQEMEFEVALQVPENITVLQGETIKREAKKLLKKAIDRKSVIKVRLFPETCEA